MLNRKEWGALVTKRMQQVLIDSGLGDKPASRVTGLSNQTIRNIREGNRVYFNTATLIAFADGMNVSLDYLMGRVSEKDMDKYFSDRKIFLKKVYGEVARIEGVREKAEKGFDSFDEMEMAGRMWDMFVDTAPYPYNIIADILDAGNKSDYQARRNIALLPVDEDVEKGLEEAMKRLTDREREFTLMYYRGGKTLEECGKKYGVTRARAYQIISKSIRKLQHPSSRLLIIYGYKGFGARKRREAAERELHEARRLESESRKVSGKILKLNKKK